MLGYYPPTGLSVPSAQSLASRAVENLTCKPGNGSTGLRETRAQAASLSLEMCIIVVNRITSQSKQRGKADGVQWPEGSSPRRDKASVQDTTGV